MQHNCLYGRDHILALPGYLSNDKLQKNQKWAIAYPYKKMRSHWLCTLSILEKLQPVILALNRYRELGGCISINT